MKKTIVTAALLIAATITAGCGSSGSSVTSSDTGAAKSTISGAVADGYLENATVFMDKSDPPNYQLDSGEPSTTTDADGKYTLTVDPADVGLYPVVALAIAGQTIDHDTTVTTLANSYVLCIDRRALSGTVSNFISPFSTQIREMMETGLYTDVAAAAEALGAQLGVPAATMTRDYILHEDTAAHATARNMASLMGSQAAQVMPGNKIDINHYRGMMGSIFGNMATISTINTAQTAAMTQLRERIFTTVSQIPLTPQVNSFMNFSSSYRSRMMGAR